MTFLCGFLVGSVFSLVLTCVLVAGKANSAEVEVPE